MSDGSAGLGLGDEGPVASLPVLEGKALLFRALADIDAVPLALDAAKQALVRDLDLRAGGPVSDLARGADALIGLSVPPFPACSEELWTRTCRASTERGCGGQRRLWLTLSRSQVRKPYCPVSSMTEWSRRWRVQSRHGMSDRPLRCVALTVAGFDDSTRRTSL